MGGHETHGALDAQPRPWLRAGAVVLPILKCAVCPACLSIFGSVFAGARLGFVESERWHGVIILVALVADFGILWASTRHHARYGPLALCVAGAAIAVVGHLFSELVEYAGFALLLGAGLWNLALLRRHRRAAGSCCAHEHAPPRVAQARSVA
jgi:hypothetical protein